MKITVDFYMFEKAFNESYYYRNKYSREALKAIFEYLNEWEDSVGVEMELDLVAIAGSFSEYRDFEEVAEEYNIKDIKELEDKKTILKLDNGGYVIF